MDGWSGVHGFEVRVSVIRGVFGVFLGICTDVISADMFMVDVRLFILFGAGVL